MHPFEYSAGALLEAYRSGALSPVEAMQDVLRRVDRFEPHIHATYLYAPERALAEARASEERWRRGAPIGPLDGVPTTVKDNIATKGEPVPVGTAASDMTPAAADAPPAARLREAGAIIFAKTTMPDYGMLSSGFRAFTRLRATRGISRATPAVPRRARERRPPPDTARCTSAPTSAARCACRRAGAGSSA